ncbi:MAG: ATP-binding protein [Deltaproteobacteria bacterium]|nr:ATP-binding protein [Myxococcales bacterium]MDP3216673.1 ATP-binding protein [Deltaproteobacteria bacterium]
MTATFTGDVPTLASVTHAPGATFDLRRQSEQQRGLFAPMPDQPEIMLLLASLRTYLEGDEAFLARTMSIAFGPRACQQGLSVRYARCVDLIDDLYAGLANGSYHAQLKRWCATLLIIDDVGLGQVKKREDEPTAAHTLYNLLDRRHTHAATAITSNIKLSAGAATSATRRWRRRSSTGSRCGRCGSTSTGGATASTSGRSARASTTTPADDTTDP